MPKQQDRSASTTKANSQPDQANASNNAAASKDSEILQAIVKLKAEIQEDSRQNIDKLSHEINGKLDNIAWDIQCLSERVDEAESRITQLESWAEEVTMAMCTSLEEWKNLQQKITDLESRSQRNNIRLFSLLEGGETNPVP